MTQSTRKSNPWRGSESAGLALLLLGAAGLQTALTTGLSVTSGLLLAVGVLALVAILRWVPFSAAFKYLASADSAVLILVAVGVLTFIGTVFLQGLPHGELVEHYGALAVPLEALHLDDVFHSAPFALCLGLLGVTSVVTVIQRRRGLARWKHAGILATHVSVVLILIGGLVGMLTGHKGMIHLEVGGSADTFLENPTPEHPIGQDLPLGFEVRLDSFELDRHVPVYRFYTYGTSDKGEMSVLQSDAAVVGEQVGSPATDSEYTVVVDKVFRSLKMNGDPVHTVQIGGKSVRVAIGDTHALPDGRRLTVKQFLPDFTYDIKSKRATSRSPKAANPALEVELTDAGASSLHYLFGKASMRQAMAARQHAALVDVTYSYQAVPTGAGADRFLDDPDGLPNPAVAVTVQSPGKGDVKLILMALEPRPLPLGTGRMLVYRDKPNDIKNYESRLSIVVDGHVEVSEIVRVNEPLSYAGFELYQSNFDPDNPRYSGIQVVQDPGLPIVTFGLWLLLAGVFHTVTLRRRRSWRRKRKTGKPVGWQPDGQEVLA